MKRVGCRHSSVVSSAPTILLFESQAHHLRFYIKIERVERGRVEGANQLQSPFVLDRDLL